MMASGSSKKRSGASSRPPVIRQRQGLPWLTIIAVGVVVVLAGAITWVVLDKKGEQDQVASFVPTAENPDPSVNIEGIFVGASTPPAEGRPNEEYVAYKAALHVSPDERVAYDRFPPVGGPHDAQWADCQGTVYTKPVRDENMVHTLEHGAIWIAYNPDSVSDAELQTLKGYVEGETYISLSPYPGLKKKVSLQAWAHQLQLDSVDDQRIREFITSLRQNTFVYPETGATCDGGPSWNSEDPPAFDDSPRTKDDIQMDGQGAVVNSEQMGAEAVAGTDASGSEPAGTEDSAADGTDASGTDTSGTAGSDTEGSGAAGSDAQGSDAQQTDSTESGAESAATATS